MDDTPERFEYEEISTGTETRVLLPRDLTTQTVKRIAANALAGPDENTDVGHAFKRRYGTQEMLAYLTTMPLSTPIRFTPSTVGLYFPRPKEEPWRATAQTLNNKKSEQSFLIGNANNMAFITDRIVGTTPLENLRILLPSWVIGINQVTSAKASERKSEIESIISEQGWVVGLMAMASSGMDEKEILKHFQQFENDFDIKMPKRGWFADNKGLNHLSRIINSSPKFDGVRLDYETLNQIEVNIDSLYKILPENNLPVMDPRELRQKAPVVIKKAKLAFVLPSEHEYIIREGVQTRLGKAEIHQSPKLQKPSNKYIDRFITVYPIINEVDFYPFTPFKVYDKEAGH